MLIVCTCVPEKYSVLKLKHGVSGFNYVAQAIFTILWHHAASVTSWNIIAVELHWFGDGVVKLLAEERFCKKIFCNVHSLLKSVYVLQGVF